MMPTMSLIPSVAVCPPKLPKGVSMGWVAVAFALSTAAIARPQLRIDRGDFIVVGKHVLAKRCENFVPLVVAGTCIQRLDRASIEKLLALDEPLKIVLHLLELVPGR